ncbi:hypothetical protein ACF0H5_011129 [Mactra antiquata]
MHNQIIARLRHLTEERQRKNIPEKNAQIEKWLEGVKRYAHHWTTTTSPVFKPVDSREYTTNISWDRGDSGIDSVNSSNTQVLNNQDSRQFRSSLVTSRSKTFLQKDIPNTVRTYRKECRRLKILPLRRVLGQFGRKRIILNDLCLSTSDVRACCKGLLHETSATYLDLSGNTLCSLGCSYIIQLLTSNKDFKELRIADNSLTGVGIVSFMRYFQTYHVIVTLDISGNRLTDNDGLVVATIIKVSPQLRVLAAHHNEFRDLAGKAIGKVLASRCGLEELDLSWNHLRQRGAIGMARGLERNKSLEYVNLGWNGFGFEGCVAMSDVLKNNTHIDKLDLSCNRIHPPALLELMKGLLHNKVLRTLILDKNPITPSFVTVLMEGIAKTPEIALEELSLLGVVVDRDFQGILDSIQQERNFHVDYEMSLPVTSRRRDDLMREIETRNSYNIEPLRMLYLLKERNRAQDFFHKINKDHDEGLTPNELTQLFKESGLPVSKYIVDKIMDFMDTDGDGQIDLGEFLVGDKKMKKISRDYARNSITEEGQYSRYSRTFRKAHIQQMTSRLKVEETQNYLSPIASLTPTPTSSRRSSLNLP